MTKTQEEVKKMVSENMQEAADPALSLPLEGQEVTQKEPEEEGDAEGRNFTKDAGFARLRREAEATKEENRRLKDALGRLIGLEEGEKTLPEEAQKEEGGAQGFGRGEAFSPYPYEEEAKERLALLEWENRQLKEREHQRIFDDDLSAIRSLFPDVKAKTVFDLGEDFVRLRAAGVDTVTAFEAIRARQEKETKKRPPSTGSVKSYTTPRQEYFTEGELDRLTKRELDNPKILQKAIASLTKIR
jgi:hypothetical protein